VDYGVRRSAWLVVQYVGGLDVVVAEVMAEEEGTVQTARRVKAWVDQSAGREHPPFAIYSDPAGGARDISDSTKGPRVMLGEVWGQFPQHYSPRTWCRVKQEQLEVVRSQLLSGFGARTLCVSDRLWSDGVQVSGAHGSPSKRGVLEAFREAAWPTKESLIDSSIDAQLAGPLEHVIDALCYGTICRHRPSGVKAFASRENVVDFPARA
jgi:hypothetical protein